MNQLTRSILEDLVKMDVSLSEITFEGPQDARDYVQDIEPQPAEMIRKILGLPGDQRDYILNVLVDVYKRKLTVGAAVDLLIKETQILPPVPELSDNDRV